MPEYRLFSWGANSHGQLGLGDNELQELITPTEVDLTSIDLEAENIKKIVGGAGHTLILEESGDVYSCGWNGKGQTGLSKASSRFQKLDSFDGHKIIDVACGWDSSMALAKNGEVYVWGSNFNGQLGPYIGSKIEKPLKLEFDELVKQISMGLRHSVLLTRDSRIFVCGAAEKGQLGVDVINTRYSSDLLLVPDFYPIKNIACGQHYTMVFTESNEIYGWGDNKYGQLGISPLALKLTSTPIRTQYIEACDEIHCGWTHTAILTRDKKVYSWGRNSYGQLGRSDSSKTEFWRPEAPLLSTKIDRLSIGSEHNIAITENGSILSWGWNEHGNCGNGSIDDILVPTKVNIPEGSATLIGTGAGHSFAVVKVDC